MEDESDEAVRRRWLRFFPNQEDMPPLTEATRPLILARIRKMEEEVAARQTTSSKERPHPKPARGQAARESATSSVNDITDRGKTDRKEEEGAFTLVFLDLEATGLAGTWPRPRITEVSMVAIGRDEFTRFAEQISRAQPTLAVKIRPRVSDRLTLCLRPTTTVPSHVAELTGLDNFNLEGQKSFGQHTGEAIKAFLGHLVQPACLVAHNGNRYDFPLLAAELKACGQWEAVAGTGVLCLDSLTILRDIFKDEDAAAANVDMDEHLPEGIGLLPATPPRKEKEDSHNSFLPRVPPRDTEFGLPVTPPSSGSKRTTPNKTSAAKPTFKNLSDSFEGVVQNGGQVIPAEAFENFVHGPPPGVMAAAPPLPVFQGQQHSPDAEDLWQTNEVTPDKMLAAPGPPPPQAPRRPKRPFSARTTTSDAGRPPKARKRLDFNAGHTGPSFAWRRSASLGALHARLFDGISPPAAHSAENDCFALARVCAARREAFLAAAAARRPLTSVAPMWSFSHPKHREGATV